MSLLVKDIMTTKLVKLNQGATLEDAHQITRDKGIRHLPVVDQLTGKLVAVVTQKAMIAKVMSALALYGGKTLSQHEAQTSIMEVATHDYTTVKENDLLKDVVTFFVDNKHGCLPVVDEENRLLGMVTSSDFVKLAAQLLNEKE
ncbi:CBS domain-containing protein [Aestuariibacter sp. AA17]|uniref:CBS domain-containing protein n=1 Tax=Fluctibacter corallii TaxID=2984329 RepID=A0ABT3ABS8_9ALTE|nr:CBS domain-containing protein [Aestuariibacter sp. AA17]MCV2886131.1 CBS domain-containing protein [Aestuariibacter sp. AA17]